ncbi:MAG: hypothetical protein ABW061_04645 [Polyangiaceae bacterium]
MRELRRFAALLLCLVGIAYPGRASAQSAARIELEWTALEGCPSADTILARVREIAGATRATPNTLRAAATVTQPSGGLFRLRLEIRYGNLAAVRDIEGKSCKDLAGAAAVALALLLSSEEPLSERDLAGTSVTAAGPDSANGKQGPETDTKATVQNQPPTTPAPSTQATSPSSSGVETGPPRRWRVLLLAPFGALGVGPMKQVSLGLGGGVGLSFDRWRFVAAGTLWASQHEMVLHVGEPYDVELDRLSAKARGCRVLFGGLFELAPCALMSVHHLTVRGGGRSFEPSGTQTATWAALGIGAQTRISIAPWLGLVAAVDGELQLSRPEVGASPPPESQLPVADLVERLAPAAATISVGAEWIF